MPPKQGQEHLHPNYGKFEPWNDGSMGYYEDLNVEDPNYPCHWSSLGSIVVPIPDPEGDDEGDHDGIWYPSFRPDIRKWQLEEGCHPITGKPMPTTYSYNEGDEYNEEFGGSDES